MAYDATLIKQIAEMREKRAKARLSKKYSIVCEHIMFSPDPVSTVVTKTDTNHPNHDGKIYACNSCSLAIDEKNGLDLLSGKLYVAEEKLFRKNIKSLILR